MIRTSRIIAWWRALDESWRFAITAFLIVRSGYGIWSLLILTIQPLAVQNIVYAGEPVLTIFNLKTSESHTYGRQIEEHLLTFRAVGDSALQDNETMSQWSARTGLGLNGAFAGERLPDSRLSPADIFPYHHARPHPYPWLSIWQRFDANWYISLAEQGYGGVPGDDHFPPLFPVLLRLLIPVSGDPLTAGLVLSHVMTFLLIKLLYDLFVDWGGRSEGRRALWFYLIYPTSFFLFSVYSESLFLVLAILALRNMQRGTWRWAGFWTFCAILTRLQGAALLPPMIFLMWRDHPFLRRPEQWPGLLLPGLGGLVYLMLRSTQVGDGAVPMVEAAWHARLVPPWETYGYALKTVLSGNATFIDVLNWCVATLFVMLLIASWKRIPLEHALFTAFSLLVIFIRIVETQPLISMSRYSLTLFPAFLILGTAGGNPWLRRLIGYTFLLLALYLSAQFFSWGWVA